MLLQKKKRKKIKNQVILGDLTTTLLLLGECNSFLMYP